MTRQAYAVELGKQLREMRVAAEMKQAEVATLLDVSPASVSGWELGKVAISDYDARRLRSLYRRTQAAKMKILQVVPP